MRPLLLTALCLTLAACKQGPEPAQVSQKLAQGVLLPSYQNWQQANQQLAQSAESFCQNTQDLTNARQSFLAAQREWARLQPVLVGHLAEGNRAWQVQFWPDKKNLVQRQVESLLNRQQPLTQADLDKASVVVQGLSAYEYVLFDASIDLNQPESKSRYCPLLTGIAHHQQTLANDTLAAWQKADGMVSQLSQFPNARFADGQEALAEILRTQVNGLDTLKKKLGAPLGRQNKGVAQPYQAEAWRSQASLSLLNAHLEGAEKLWHGAHQDGIRSLLGAEHRQLAGQIDQAFLAVRDQLASLQQPLVTLLESENGRQQLDALYQRLDSLQRLLGGPLASALNVQLGFNANDGD